MKTGSNFNIEPYDAVKNPNSVLGMTRDKFIELYPDAPDAGKIFDVLTKAGKAKASKAKAQD